MLTQGFPAIEKLSREGRWDRKDTCFQKIKLHGGEMQPEWFLETNLIVTPR